MSAYQPKTGAKCGCRRGVQRDNCPRCEGTGMVIDFKAIREKASQPAAPVGGAQFTPGPWVVNTFIVNGQHKLEVLDTTGANVCVQANAHLIAAAPAMYEALKRIKVLMESGDIEGRDWVEYGRIINALAQAEGRQG